MNREYHKRYSQELNRDMDVLVFGYAGTPLVVFPTSMDVFLSMKIVEMIGVLGRKIERGELQVFCPDAVDTESWYNRGVHPQGAGNAAPAVRRYILNELLPFVRWRTRRQAGDDRLQLLERITRSISR